MHTGDRLKTAVLLMAYGSPTRMEDVMGYLEGIYEGKPVPQYAIDENTKKYRMFGGKSPSNRIVENVAEKLSSSLSADGDFKVFLGNKHWKPTLDDAVSAISGFSPENVIAIPLFPFPSKNVVNSYRNPLKESLEASGMDIGLKVVNGFNEQELFLKSWLDVLEGYVSGFPEDTFYLFSAHSLPTTRSPEENYRQSFLQTAEKLASMLGLKHYGAAFQSRGKYGAKWLEPSVEDALESNLGRMGKSLVAIPLGFIYDHLEILYDLDYEFRNLVKSRGKEYHRSSLPNDSDTFVSCLKEAVMSAISSNK